jgi:hypothetical protein
MKNKSLWLASRLDQLQAEMPFMMGCNFQRFSSDDFVSF